ncbi:GntR family transcriptional regulator [Novipirellula artificiosorum]|uniref:Putative HTH-type transcriptional regulator YdfH n=1 Tax=Novipirellula artificiosorum TaxID=2528016 RepID=A0A5C6DS86_9BACT|nr:GntR family transcriptional regulator [Novipirellula artificiosorum]TWU39638.1 putative HTH-type transcriptional regulator YdfH [Novipirellula artificiosorum]
MEQTLAEKSYDYIRGKLASHDLPPGKRLVNRVLASEIGVSVIPVREAIHRLASEGFVDHVPGSGAFVRKTDPQDIDDLYVLRDALESCAAGEAARYITDHQLDELESILSKAEEIAQQISKRPKQHATKIQMNAWLDTERSFHQLVFEAARNQLLAKVAREQRAIGQIFDAQRDDPQLLTSDVALTTISGKRQLIDALRQRNHEKARKLMSQQIQRGRKEVLRHLRTTAKQ